MRARLRQAGLTSVAVALGACHLLYPFDPSGSARRPDAGAAPDGASDGLTDADARVRVSALRAEWTTPHWVFWRFLTEGTAGDLEVLEFVLAETPAEVLARSGSSVQIKRHERVLFGLDDAAPLDSIGRMLSGTLLADRVYFGQLTAIDTAGRRSATEVVGARTMAVPQREQVIFADDDTPGYSIPAELVRSNRAPHAGTHHYSWTAGCAQATCYEILRRQNLGLALNGIDRGSFDESAFFEFALASNSSVPWAARLRVWFGDGERTELLADFGSFPVPTDDAYHLYEIPLRALDSGGTGVVFDKVTQGLFEFGVDGTWSQGSETRLDEWRVRW